MNLFKDSSSYYKYRPEYSEEVIKLIISKIHVDGTSNLLDIGCGPGSLSIPLSKYFKKVFAVDIDSGMIKEGQSKANILSANNINWINDNANSLKYDLLNDVQVVTFGCSLHWFDSLKMLNLMHRLLPENGAVVIIGIRTIWTYAPQPWQQKVLEIIKKYLGPHRMTLNGEYKPTGTKNDFIDFLQKSGFRRTEKIEFNLPIRILNIDDVIGLLFSMSFAAPGLFKDKLVDFEREVKTELLKIHPDNKFPENNTGSIIMGWKN